MTLYKMHTWPKREKLLLFYTTKEDMKTYLIICLLAGVHPVESVTRVTGYVGRSALVKCTYDIGYEGYSKYLCRGSCPYVGGKDIPIRTEEGQTKAVNGRFSLHENTTARVFTVTITGLTAQDSGQYWCGVKTGFGKTDLYSEVKLNVNEEPSSTPASTLLPSTENLTLSSSPSPGRSNTSQSEHVSETTIHGLVTAAEHQESRGDKGGQRDPVIFLSLSALVLLALVTACGLLSVFYHKQKRKKKSADCSPSSPHNSEHTEEPCIYETYEEPGDVSKPRASVSSLYCLVGPNEQPSVLSLSSTVSNTPADSSGSKTPEEKSTISPVTQESEQHIYDNSQENIAIYSNDILPEETAFPTMQYSNAVSSQLSTSVSIPSALNGDDDFI